MMLLVLVACSHPGEHDVTDLMHHRVFSALLHGFTQAGCKGRKTTGHNDVRISGELLYFLEHTGEQSHLKIQII